VNYVDKTWVNQNYTQKSCWKICDKSHGLKVPASMAYNVP